MIGGAIGGIIAVAIAYILGWNIPKWVAAGRAANGKPIAASIAISIACSLLGMAMAALLFVPTAREIFSATFAALLFLPPIAIWRGWRKIHRSSLGVRARLNLLPIRKITAAFCIWTIAILTYEAFSDPFWVESSMYGAFDRELWAFLQLWLLPPAAAGLCSLIWLWGFSARHQS